MTTPPNQAGWRALYREATAVAPAGARERVWQQVKAPKGRWLRKSVQAGVQAAVVVAAVAAAALALWWWLHQGAAQQPTPGPVVGARYDKALLEQAAVAEAESDAERALDDGRWEDAAAAYARVGNSGNLLAEAALLKKGDLELRQLKAPARALQTFEEGDRRFPDGSLAAERALSALEACVEMEQWDEATRRADAFLARFPDSERLEHVRSVRAAIDRLRLKEKP